MVDATAWESAKDLKDNDAKGRRRTGSRGRTGSGGRLGSELSPAPAGIKDLARKMPAPRVAPVIPAAVQELLSADDPEVFFRRFERLDTHSPREALAAAAAKLLRGGHPELCRRLVALVGNLGVRSPALAAATLVRVMVENPDAGIVAGAKQALSSLIEDIERQRTSQPRSSHQPRRWENDARRGKGSMGSSPDVLRQRVGRCSMSAVIVGLAFPLPPEPFSGAAQREVPQAASVVVDHTWDAAFTRTSSWTGGDVAGSIDLGDGRTLWLFGDSWIGNVSQGKHVPGSRLVNNSLAVHRSNPDKSRTAPNPDEIRFHWGPNDDQKHPTAWIVPDRKPAGPDADAGKDDWYWPTGGGVVVPGKAGATRFVLFLYRVRRGDRPETAWNFQVVGTAMAVVDRAGEPLDNWRPRQVDIPQPPANKGSSPDGKIPVMRWGMAACLDAADATGDNRHVYIFGTRSGGPLDMRLVVARTAAEHIERFEDWRFFAGNGRWSDQPADAAPLADGLVTEFSIDRIQKDGGACWVLVQSEPLFGRRILARTSARPEGPWSKPVAIHTVAEVEGQPSLFTYAAKAHGALSRPGEILATYIVSSHKFAELVNDTKLYRPRFVRVPIQLLPEAP